MKVVKIWADIHSTGLFDSKGSHIMIEETTISTTTWKKLQEWVEEYDDIAIMDMDERLKHKEQIDKLDVIGIELTKTISKEWKYDKTTGEKIKFRYFSEGRLKYLF